MAKMITAINSAKPHSDATTASTNLAVLGVNGRIMTGSHCLHNCGMVYCKGHVILVFQIKLILAATIYDHRWEHADFCHRCLLYLHYGQLWDSWSYWSSFNIWTTCCWSNVDFIKVNDTSDFLNGLLNTNRNWKVILATKTAIFKKCSILQFATDFAVDRSEIWQQYSEHFEVDGFTVLAKQNLLPR